MAFIIYMHTCMISGKSYIGFTKKSIEKRWEEHLYAAFNKNKNWKFSNALRKYSVDNWQHEIIEFLGDVTTKDASAAETYWIEWYDTFKKGYNSTLGGEGGARIVTEETRAKLSAAGKGKKKSPEHIEKIASKHRGRKHSLEHIENRARRVRGQKRTPEQCANMSAILRGKKRAPFSKEWLANMSAARKGKKMFVIDGKKQFLRPEDIRNLRKN